MRVSYNPNPSIANVISFIGDVGGDAGCAQLLSRFCRAVLCCAVVFCSVGRRTLSLDHAVRGRYGTSHRAKRDFH